MINKVITDKMVEKLDVVGRALEKQNEIVQNMLDVMRKPSNRFIDGVVLVGLIVGALSVVNIIDTILRWFLGG